MVIYHADWNLQKYDLGTGSLLLFAGRHGVEFFFVISGFIIYYVHGKEIGNPAFLGRYVTNRFVRIYPIFWVVMFLLIAGQVLLTELDPEFTTVGGIFRSFLLMPYADYPPLGVAWTLSYEMLFYILFATTIFAGPKAFAFMGVWWAISAAYWLTYVFTGYRMDFPLEFLFSPYNLLFLMGILTARYFTALPGRLALPMILFGVAILAVLTFRPLWWPLRMEAPLWGLAFTLVIAGIARIEFSRTIRFPRFAILLGDASYSIYLIHDMVMVVLGSIVFVRLLDGAVPAMVQLVVMVVAGIVAGLCLYFFAERPLLRYLRKLSTRPAPARA